MAKASKASGVAGVGCSGVRGADLSHLTFPSEREGSQSQTLGREHQASPAVRHLHPSPPSETVSADLQKEAVDGSAMSWVNPATAESSSDCCIHPYGFLVCFFPSKSIQFI